jgi:hypothetical protein
MSKRTTPVDLDTIVIPKGEHKDLMASFWTMLQENAGRAADSGDAVLRLWVEGWFKQWNRITGNNQSPPWVQASEGHKTLEDLAAGDEVNVVPTQGGHQKKMRGVVIKATRTQLTVQDPRRPYGVKYLRADGMPAFKRDREFPCYCLKV